MCLLNYFTTNSERIAKHFWQNHSRQFHEFHELWQNDLQISQQIITELKQKAKSMEAQQMTDTWTFVQLSLTRHDQMNWAALGAAVGRELLIEAVLWKSFECLCSSLKSGDKTSTPAWPFHSSGRAIVLQITDIVWGMFKERLKDSLGMGGWRSIVYYKNKPRNEKRLMKEKHGKRRLRNLYHSTDILHVYNFKSSGDLVCGFIRLGAFYNSTHTQYKTTVIVLSILDLHLLQSCIVSTRCN